MTTLLQLGVYMSLNFWEGEMAQAYIKLELLEFPSNYCDVKLPMRRQHKT